MDSAPIIHTSRAADRVERTRPLYSLAIFALVTALAPATLRAQIVVDSAGELQDAVADPGNAEATILVLPGVYDIGSNLVLQEGMGLAGLQELEFANGVPVGVAPSNETVLLNTTVIAGQRNTVEGLSLTNPDGRRLVNAGAFVGAPLESLVLRECLFQLSMEESLFIDAGGVADARITIERCLSRQGNGISVLVFPLSGPGSAEVIARDNHVTGGFAGFIYGAAAFQPSGGELTVISSGNVVEGCFFGAAYEGGAVFAQNGSMLVHSRFDVFANNAFHLALWGGWTGGSSNTLRANLIGTRMSGARISNASILGTFNPDGPPMGRNNSVKVSVVGVTVADGGVTYPDASPDDLGNEVCFTGNPRSFAETNEGLEAPPDDLFGCDDDG